MSYLNLPKRTETKIRDLAKQLRELDRRAQDVDLDDPDGVSPYNERWNRLQESARQLYLRDISPRMAQIQDIRQQEWPELEQLENDRSFTPLESEEFIGPVWDSDREDFDDYRPDPTGLDLSDGLAGSLAEELLELVKRRRLNAKDRRILQNYRDVLLRRVKLLNQLIG
jgi:hypothetical protein